MKVLQLIILLLPVAGMAQEIRVKVDALIRDTEKVEAAEKLERLADLYMDYQIENFPEFGAFVGKPADNSRWTDMSLEAIERRRRDNDIFLRAIESIDRSKLNADDQLNYDLLLSTFRQNKEGQKFPSHLMPIDQMGGYHQQIAQVTRITPVVSHADAKDFISRMDNVPKLVDQLIVLMEKGMAEGIVPPKVAIAGVPEQIENIISIDPHASPLLSNLRSFASKDPSSRAALEQEAVRTVKEEVYPALARLKDFFEKRYIPAARTSIGLKALPDGEAWYNHNIRVTTTTSLGYKEIHEIGLREVARIRKAMDSLKDASGFKGSFDAFTTFLRTDPRFFYEDSAALLDGYRVIAKKIDMELPRFFGKLPRLPYGVLPVPAYDEKFQTTAYYMPGSAEAGRAGVFYANTYDLKSRPKWEMEALTIHEAVPGHHLQIALAAELEDVPDFRKHSFYTAFVEGWGLYAESLGDEMGFYQDPYSKFGQLTYEMWRAVRLVVDTGIHGMGWSRQQAIDYFKANAPKAEHDIIVEVDRYIAWPSQALAYKIGELKIKELRARAEAKLGDKFDLRAFHDAVLENGAIPLDVLERKIEEWMTKYE